ncbi:MAG: hypothetical protein H7Z74_12220 [Anaerolineae bacterium]|nr:hypothetical protein [Gemmatimonadaceae bacterium]
MAGRIGSQLNSLLQGWRTTRSDRARARAYVTTLFAEPSPDDTAWLAEHGTRGDVDHALWELRYARRALGLIVAQRDALNDQTASLVARALAAALGRDRSVAAGKLRVSEQQLNTRLRAYADALGNRAGAGSAWHLGRTLLRFAGRVEGTPPEGVSRASDILTNYLADANEALREQFGGAELVEPATRER